MDMDNEKYQKERKRLAANTLATIGLIPLSAMSVNLVSSVNPEEPNDGSCIYVGSLLAVAKARNLCREETEKKKNDK
jgi:hypothetical protein